MHSTTQKSQYLSQSVWLLICLGFWWWSAPAAAQQQQTVNLTLSPEKCVALRQGQTCYVDIVLNWSASAADDYCLYAEKQEKPLRCWDNATKGKFETEFSSNENSHFYLRKANITLAQVELKMAWVYKSKRSSVTWRVF